MSGAIYYPPADHTSEWFGPGNAIITPNKIVWHTLEGYGAPNWPSFNNGGEAPNLTYDPKSHQWRQHFQLNGSSRALKNSPDGTYQTNRKNVCQVEIAGTDGWSAQLVAEGLGIWQIDDQAVNDLSAFAHFMHDEWGIPLTTSLDWPAYPAAPYRMSVTEYENYTGHLGHMHVPYNDHGDPQNLPIARILNTPAVTTNGEDWMPLNDADKAFFSELSNGQTQYLKQVLLNDLPTYLESHFAHLFGVQGIVGAGDAVNHIRALTNDPVSLQNFITALQAAETAVKNPVTPPSV